MLITVEGIDKAGKGVLCSGLREEYPDAVFTTEPYEDGWTGQLVKKALRGEIDVHPFGVASMFLIDHASHVHDVVRPALDAGDTVICDRYIDSRYAYQMESLRDYTPGEPLEWLVRMNETMIDTEVPDLTLLLDITASESIERMGDEPSERFERKNFLRRVRRNYHYLAEKYDNRFVVIDAKQEPKKVVADCLDVIESAKN